MYTIWARTEHAGSVSGLPAQEGFVCGTMSLHVEGVN